MKSKIQNPNNKTRVLLFIICHLAFIWNLSFGICHLSFAQDEFKYDSKGKRDPFIPLVTSGGRILKLDREEGALSDLLLEGIIYDKIGVSYAIVNSFIVKVGDSAGDYQVLKIEEDRVIFIKDGQPTEVELKKEE